LDQAKETVKDIRSGVNKADVDQKIEQTAEATKEMKEDFKDWAKTKIVEAQQLLEGWKGSIENEEFDKKFDEIVDVAKEHIKEAKDLAVEKTDAALKSTENKIGEAADATKSKSVDKNIDKAVDRYAEKAKDATKEVKEKAVEGLSKAQEKTEGIKNMDMAPESTFQAIKGELGDIKDTAFSKLGGAVDYVSSFFGGEKKEEK